MENNFKTRWYHGKGHTKYTDEEVDFVLEMFKDGFGRKKITVSFNEKYGHNVCASTILRISREPHKYKVGYVKQRSLGVLL